MNESMTAIVTGASRGIGASVAERLARDGFSVVVNFVRSAARAEALVRAIESFGGVASAIQADVSDAEAVRRMFRETQQEFGSVHVLVNSAAIMQSASVVDTTDAAFDRSVAVNLKGAFNAMREAASRLHRGGRIINLSCGAVAAFPAHCAVYAATRAGVEAMTRTLSKELRDRQITVNAVALELAAVHRTPSTTDSCESQRPDAEAPSADFRQPDDIAAIVAFLAGPEAGWVNGQVIRADGGFI